MKPFHVFTAMCLALVSCGRTLPETTDFIGNPYLPLWEHMPDGEPRVFEDPDNPGKFRIYVTGHDTDFLNTMSLHKSLIRFCSSLNYLDHYKKIECVTSDTANALKIVRLCQQRGMSIEMYLIERSK